MKGSFQGFLYLKLSYFLIFLTVAMSFNHALANRDEEETALMGSINRSSGHHTVLPEQIARDTHLREAKALFPFSTMIASALAAGVEGHNPWGYGVAFVSGFSSFVAPRGVFKCIAPGNRSDLYHYAERWAYRISGISAALGVGAILLSFSEIKPPLREA